MKLQPPSADRNDIYVIYSMTVYIVTAELELSVYAQHTCSAVFADGRLDTDDSGQNYDTGASSYRW